MQGTTIKKNIAKCFGWQ